MKYVPKVIISFQPAPKTGLPVGAGTFPITTSLGEALQRAIPNIGAVRILLNGKVLDQDKSLEDLGLKNDNVLTLTF